MKLTCYCIYTQKKSMDVSSMGKLDLTWDEETHIDR